MVIAAIMLWLAALPGFAERVGFQPDYDFQDQMDKVKEDGHDCLPPSYSIQLDPFWVRVGGKAFDTCVSENMTTTQLIKYMALGAGSLTPAGVYLAPYTASELKSDGVKCLMKAYVEASDSLSSSEKDNWRGRIDAGFAVKDWAGFAGNIKEFADPDAAKVTKAFVEFSAASLERMSEAKSFSEAMKAAMEQSWRDVSIYFYGELPVVLEEYDQYVKECRYGLARTALDRAIKLADRECRALGHEYRLLEQEIVSSIYRNWEVMGQDLIGDDPAMVLLRNQQRSMKRDLVDAKNEVLDYVKNFDELEKKDKALERLTWQFEKEQADYARQLERTRQALDGPAACYAIGELRNLLSDKTGACRASFFRGPLAGLNGQPEAVEQELYLVASRKSSEWWGEVSQIRTLFNTCREGEGFSRIAALKSKVQADPIVLVTEDGCKPVDQPVLMETLDKFAPLPHCRKTTVPEIVGQSLATAAGMLNDAELVISGKPEMVEPKEGQTPGTVVKSDPKPGSSARIWTGVKLAVLDKFPEEEEELVEMPEVLGLTETAAKEAVSDAGLTPVVKKGLAANKIEYKPEYIYHATHDEGDMLPPLTEVVMTKYGPRPMVKVPTIAGPDIAKARGILSAAGLTPGDPAAGDPPPEGKEPGEIYGSIPEAESEQEMFTTVQPLVYGLRAQQPGEEGGDEAGDEGDDEGEGDDEAETRPIPTVSGKPPAVATSMIEADDFFVAGSISPGNPAKDDEVPGMVQSTVPAIGSPQPKGTVVNMLIVMPVQGGDEAPAPQEDTAQPEPEGDGGGWIGRWRVAGTHTSDSGKTTEIRGLMEIAQEQGILILTWSTEKDGALKEVIKLPMANGADNVLRLHPSALKSMEDDGAGSESSGGIIGQEVSKIALMFREILKTLAISRQGEQCALTVTDPKKGPMTLAFSCIREEGASQ
ncbi:Stk1 family PASTA domain-containing Ser/Thr kinase [Thalassovita mangrovi]|uniref:PASTA domain-containing protein n=1 Tax=Thalassovita mangrovi TaxID=2692236 RepID=A0A6L8LFJ0_9RHOB|nr:Stk1 family PASTA domain-containing Ser/Thr kinase [Thalassovita mangrovi]MYM54821.1 PASTA domain-containing protein [Thalassovita mangrovi]